MSWPVSYSLNRREETATSVLHNVSQLEDCNTQLWLSWLVVIGHTSFRNLQPFVNARIHEHSLRTISL